MTAPLANLFIRHPMFSDIVDALQDLMRRTLEGEQLLLPICGPSRVGKTFAVEPMRRQLAERRVDTKRVMPLLYVKTPSRPTLTSLPRAILVAAGVGAWAERTGPDAMTAHAVDKVQRLETKIVVVDEFQHFAQPSARATAQDVSDWLKNFFDLTKTSGVLIGTPPLVRVIDRDDQLRSRCLAIRHLLPYNWADPTQRAEYERSVDTVQSQMVTMGYVQNVPPDLALRLAVACGGRVGMTIKLLNEACNIARDSRMIDHTTLSKAYRRAINRVAGSKDPFMDDVSATDAIASFLSTMRDSKYTDDFIFSAAAESDGGHRAVEALRSVKRNVDAAKVAEIVKC